MYIFFLCALLYEYAMFEVYLVKVVAECPRQSDARANDCNRVSLAAFGTKHSGLAIASIEQRAVMVLHKSNWCGENLATTPTVRCLTIMKS